jgi:leucyl/phenylalanyl-tRNA--protein transferase
MDLSVPRLLQAYRRGIFPWFSQGEPVLWWSPDPRMVLQTDNFKLHPSLRKTLKKFMRDAACEIRIDTAFDQVIGACAASARPGQKGTWIVAPMIKAYHALHKAGHAHSVETWVNGQLVGGLYCVGIGRAVFGESMFSRQTDASKIALSALVAFCRAQEISAIDCQQNTRHLASLGAAEITREDFVAHITQAQTKTNPPWEFDPLYWQQLFL